MWVKDDVLSKLPEKMKEESEKNQEYPLYFDDKGFYVTQLKAFLKEKGLLSKYEEKELKWREMRGKKIPPHMLAMHSSSRIGLYYFLKTKSKKEDCLKAEVTLPIGGVGGGVPHLDFSYKDTNGIHYVECKTSEILSTHAFKMKKSYKDIFKRYDIDIDVAEDDKYLEDISEAWLGKDEKTGKPRRSLVEFKQTFCHLLGIANEIKDNGGQRYLEYCFFYPSCYEKHPYEDEIKRDFREFKKTDYYSKLTKNDNGNAVLELSEPKFCRIDEIDDPVIQWLNFKQ